MATVATVGMAHSGIVAVFLAASWHDQAHLRLWVKTLQEQSRLWSTGLVKLVLLTDDLTDGNMVVGRQCKCSGVVSAIVRAPGLMRSPGELAKARDERDLVMAMAADLVFDFGELPGGRDRFAHKQTVLVASRQL